MTQLQIGMGSKDQTKEILSIVKLLSIQVVDKITIGEIHVEGESADIAGRALSIHKQSPLVNNLQTL